MTRLIIEIPDCYIDVVTGLMMINTNSEDDAKKLEKVADMLKQATDPVVLDASDKGILAGDEDNCKKLYLAAGAFAFAQVMKNMAG